jgi:ketosteroid isomerase-like protein
MEALRELYHEDAVMYHPPGWPEPGPSYGRDAIFRQFATLRQDFRDDRLEVLERRALGDWVVLKQRWSGLGDHSGVSSELIVCSAGHYRDGKVAEFAFYWDFDEAVAAAEAGKIP